MKEVFFLIGEPVDGEYLAKALGESIFTQAGNLEKLRANIKGVAHCHAEEKRMPKIVWLHTVKQVSNYSGIETENLKS